MKGILTVMVIALIAVGCFGVVRDIMTNKTTTATYTVTAKGNTVFDMFEKSNNKE